MQNLQGGLLLIFGLGAVFLKLEPTLTQPGAAVMCPASPRRTPLGGNLTPWLGSTARGRSAAHCTWMGSVGLEVGSSKPLSTQGMVGTRASPLSLRSGKPVEGERVLASLGHQLPLSTPSSCSSWSLQPWNALVSASMSVRDT